MERIGVLGTGRMGLPIVRRLVAAGFAVTAFDTSPERLAAATAEGAQAAASGHDLATPVDILLTVLPGPGELRVAMLGAGATDAADATATAHADHPAGALAALAAGSCWLDLTSNDPRVAVEVAALAEARGVQSVGAPMGGGPDEASAGTLRFYVGGDDAAAGRVAPILEVLGDPATLTRTGTDIGSGYTTKLLANTLWFGQAIAVTEALLLGQALGLGVSGLRDALASGPGGSAFLTHHLDALLAGDYLTTFGIDRVVEELDTVSELAAGVGTPATLTAMVGQLHREALEVFGPVAGELLGAKLLEQRAGRVIRVDSVD